MSFLRPYLYGIAAVAFLAIMTGAYVKGRADANAVCAATVRAMQDEAQAQKDAEAEKSRHVSASLEKENARVRIIYRDIVREVDKVVERPVYSGVCLDDDGVRLANAALTGSAAAPTEPDPAVPEVEPAR